MNDQVNELFEQIEKWAADRKILENSTAKAQFLKTVEEMGELSSALAKDDIEGVIDALGDVIVTLVIVARLLNLDLAQCIEEAYKVIKDRKGFLNEAGVFIRED